MLAVPMGCFFLSVGRDGDGQSLKQGKCSRNCCVDAALPYESSNRAKNLNVYIDIKKIAF